MKKIFKIILSTALLLGVTACTELLDTGQKVEIPDDARVTVTFGVPTEIATKASMASEPTIERMHVFVFNKIGVLIEAVEAKAFGAVTVNYDPTAADTTGMVSFWAADLRMGLATRHLHFIANLPLDYTLPTVGSEATVLQSIVSKAPEAAYWQRIVLDGGIGAYTYDGSGTYSYVDPTDGKKKTVPVPGTVSGDSYTYIDTDGNEYTVSKGDFINTNGKKVLDGKGLFASAETSEGVSRVPMIRNFARIRVQSSWSGFTLNQVALVNTPKAGFVAPYDDVHNRFVAPYMETGTTALTLAAVDATGYPATIPALGINTDMPTHFVTPQGGIAMLFMYERGIPVSDATCILIQGTRNGSTRWYKIEITNEEGAYFPIYRDFTYLVDIKSIEGTNGFATKEQAYASASVGDISSSVETATLEQISDGKGLTLWVEYIDHTDLTANPTQHATRLLYKCFYTNPGTSAVTNLTSHVTLSIVPYANTGAAVLSAPAGTSYSGTDTPDSGSGWYQTSVTLDGVGGTLKKSDVRVEVNLTTSQNPGGYVKRLFRNVTYRVLPKQPLIVTATPLASDAINKTTTVTVTLPANLGYSVFPLTLMIEAGNNCLTPAFAGDVTVETGKSLVDGTTNTFYFVKTIRYSDYENSSTREFDVTFKTTKTSGNTPATIYVRDKGERFDRAEVSLTVG